jgi:hypothetical protein
MVPLVDLEEAKASVNSAPERKRSKRGRLGEGRPAKRTPEVVAKIAEGIVTEVVASEGLARI